MQYLHLIWVWAGHITVLLCGSLAIWRGGWAERSTAIVIWVAWFLTPVLQKQNYDPGMLITVMDGIVVLIVFSISYYSRRIWTLFMTVFVLASFMAHFAADLVPYVGYFSYLTAMGLLGGYGVALTLGGAALEAEYLRKKSTMHA